eukprot:scaffold311_cov405-Prasinococcus_capsulatus_cf.AAC.2
MKYVINQKVEQTTEAADGASTSHASAAGVSTVASMHHALKMRLCSGCLCFTRRMASWMRLYRALRSGTVRPSARACRSTLLRSEPRWLDRNSRSGRSLAWASSMVVRPPGDCELGARKSGHLACCGEEEHDHGVRRTLEVERTVETPRPIPKTTPCIWCGDASASSWPSTGAVPRPAGMPAASFSMVARGPDHWPRRQGRSARPATAAAGPKYRVASPVLALLAAARRPVVRPRIAVVIGPSPHATQARPKLPPRLPGYQEGEDHYIM